MTNTNKMHNIIDTTSNTISKKEQAMVSAGATREESYKAIVRGLTAKKMILDKFGDEHFEDDTTNQLRSAEIIARMNGDIKPDVGVDNRQVIINMSGAGEEILKNLVIMAEDVKMQLDGLKASGRQTGEIIDI